MVPELKDGAMTRCASAGPADLCWVLRRDPGPGWGHGEVMGDMGGEVVGDMGREVMGRWVDGLGLQQGWRSP